MNEIKCRAEACTERHCTCRTGCGWHLTATQALTSTRCIAKTAGDLRAIESLSRLMIDEAVEAGVDSEAAMLAGPAADPEAWSWRQAAERSRIMAGGVTWEAIEKQLAALAADGDDRHPLALLGRWDMMLREDYDQPTTLRVTISRAVAYLAGTLDRMAQDDEQDWPLFASEVRACRSHLEAVLHDSRVPEQGAPCPECASPDPDVKAPRLVKKYADHDPTGHSDRWHCPDDAEHWWPEAAYRWRIESDHLEHAEVLTATQIEKVHGVKPGTLRKWAAEGRVHRRGYDGQRRQLYDVADTLAAKGEEVAA